MKTRNRQNRQNRPAQKPLVGRINIEPSHAKPAHALPPLGNPMAFVEQVLDFSSGALKVIQEEEGEQGQLAPTRRVRFASLTNNTMQWESDIFGKLRLTLDGFELRGFRKFPTYMCSALKMSADARPEKIGMSIEVVGTSSDISVLRVQGPQGNEVTPAQATHFEVPVTWQGTEGDVPHTRVKDVDNLDIVYVNKTNGYYTQLQLSIQTRDGQFWLVVQEVFSGQIARTTRQKAEKLRLTPKCFGAAVLVAVPLQSVFAYPGGNYLQNFRDTGYNLFDFANEHCTLQALGKCVRAEWQPPEWSKLNQKSRDLGWHNAIVLWFNITTGYGFCRLEDGRFVHLHFKNVVDESGAKVFTQMLAFPVPVPMTVIMVKIKMNQQEKWGATAILLS